MGYWENKFGNPIGGENGKIGNFFIIIVALAILGIALYILFISKNTTVVINQAAQEPKTELITGTPPAAPEETPTLNPQVTISQTGVGFLNVRNSGSTQGTKIGTVKPGETYEFTEKQNGWYHITIPGLGDGWVSGQYVTEVQQ